MNIKKWSVTIFLAAIGVSALGDAAIDGLCASDDEAVNVAAQRDSFNKAIAAKDLAGVETVLAETVILVTGTASTIYSGREAQAESWRADFESPSRAVYVRTPSCIKVSGVAPVALETGRWRGEQPGGFTAGSYAAKWRRFDDEWRIEVEIYSTESCGGDFCLPPADNNK